jgi:ABC-type transport system involved in cytochrome bd biosynthesis fused ATPase/permease subunit
VALLDKWLAQRYQLITLWLMIFILFIVYHYFDKFEMQSKGLSIVITYCVDLADKLGYLVKSVAEAEREGRNIRKFTQYNKGDDEMDLDRMTHEIKNQISHNEKGPQELALENLWFKYPGEKVDILRGLSLNVKSQEKIMIKGKTGAGKTTLFKILTKVYLPKEKLNRGYIAFSPQKPLLLIDATL